MTETIDRRQALRCCVGAAGLTLVARGAWAQAPLPAGFTPPPMVPQQMSAHCWYVQGLSALGSPKNQNFISNAGFVVTGDSVVVIDALGSPALAERLLAEIRKITPKPVKTVILTHYHADHVYGLQVFKDQGAHIIAQQLGREYLYAQTAALRLQASRTDLAPWVDDKTHLVPADEWIDGRQERTIGGMSFVLQPVGPAHTPEDLAIYLPADKVLYSGDLVFRSRIPYVGEADSRNWIASLDKLLTFGAEVVIPGHGEASHEARKDMELTRSYLIYLRKTMGQAAQDMVPFDQAYKDTDWTDWEALPLFKAANRMNAYNTYLLMEHEKP